MAVDQKRFDSLLHSLLGVETHVFEVDALFF
jgi:hypothetical protein